MPTYFMRKSILCLNDLCGKIHFLMYFKMDHALLPCCSTNVFFFKFYYKYMCIVLLLELL